MACDRSGFRFEFFKTQVKYFWCWGSSSKIEKLKKERAMNEILKNIGRRISYAIAPKTVSAIQRYRYLCKEAEKTKIISTPFLTHQERFKEIQQTPFVTQQIESEFVHAMNLVEKVKPSTVVEIGAFQGGTLSLFTQVAPTHCRFLSVDIAFGLPQKLALKRFEKPGQSISCLTGDSSSKTVIRRVRKWLNNKSIDVLFIDGDHSYNGVKKDFENYSPMVRKGGLVILHDIVEDFMTRYGTPTGSYTGGVPKFWRELKDKGYEMHEVIEDPNQDGFGIGIIIK